MRTLRQAVTEGRILAGDLVKHDHQIVGQYRGGRDNPLVESLEQGQPGFLRTPRDERQFEQDHRVGVGLPKKGRRMEIATAWEDVVDLEKIVGRNAEYSDQRGLNGFRHLSETGVVILPLQHVDLGERHVPVPLSTASVRRSTVCFGNVCRRYGSGKRRAAKRG